MLNFYSLSSTQYVVWRIGLKQIFTKADISATNLKLLCRNLFLIFLLILLQVVLCYLQDNWSTSKLNMKLFRHLCSINVCEFNLKTISVRMVIFGSSSVWIFWYYAAESRVIVCANSLLVKHVSCNIYIILVIHVYDTNWYSTLCSEKKHPFTFSLISPFSMENV